MNTANFPSSPASSTPGRWRLARRLLVAAVAAVTLIAIFYTAENWRGKRAWEKCRRELEAKGEVLDWSAYIPAPVPDDQNFFQAPKMREWLVKDSLLDLASSPRPTAAPALQPFALAPRTATNLVLAEVSVVAANAPVDARAADAVLRFDDPAAREQAAKLLRDAVGPCVFGARGCVLIGRALNQIKPLDLVVETDATPKELALLFADDPASHLAQASPVLSNLQFEPAGSNTVRVSLKAPVYGAEDYLAWTEPLTANFDLVRKALERPFARIEGNYERPFLIPIPDFIRIRQMVQILSERAQCYLLLGQSEAAWHELALVHDLCRILMAKPSGKPITLVGAMIHVAIAGLYAGIVEDGLKRHAWGEPQLLAVERQLKETDLLAPVVAAFREERAATFRTVQITKRRELVKLFTFGSSGRSGADWFRDVMSTLPLTCMPSGWFYQNMAVGGRLEQELLGSVDPTNRLVQPHQVDKPYRDLEARLQRRSPYTFLVAIGIPNFLRATQTAARNQTLVNQSRVACVLERYRLSQGQYPETLDALTPRFAAELPHDLIGGQPLKYRRGEGGGYRLYSVGWDEKDGGGVPGKSREEGDWVFEIR